MEFYWELIQHDGTRIEFPPSAADVIKRRWDKGLPIHTKFSGSIPHNQIKAFRPTDKPYSTQPLLEEVAGVFHEPVVNPDGSIACRWVRKAVTQDKWNRHYSAVPGYKKLRDEQGMTLIAMFLPIHEINVNLTPYCTDDEVNQLTGSR